MKNVTIYQTMTEIENPLGDGRHNRAKWRSPLDQTKIPAGFIFGLDEEGNIHDHSVPRQTLPATRNGVEQLRSRLLSVAGSVMVPTEVKSEPREETLEDILADTPKEAVPELLRKLGMTPAQLREALREEEPEPQQTKASRSATRRVPPPDSMQF